MYKKIFIAIDNSQHSNYCIDIGIALSRKCGAHLVGCHVYDASLHQRRFRDMEKGLPAQYQNEKELQRQRELHGTLINKGLKMISESYLDVFRKKCREACVPHEGVLLEGKNFSEIIEEINRGAYDLVIIGAVGLGAVEGSKIGSVCERVVRRINTDVLVVRNRYFNGEVVVAVDGSVPSSNGVRKAIYLAENFGTTLTAVSVFDPHYHRVAFESIANVLSKEAGQIFRFREQETLHEEIIDKGLARIYQNHLDQAQKMARNEGVYLNTLLMDGKPYCKILHYLKEKRSSLVVLGRTGVHKIEGLDIGSTPENLLRLSPCNILLTGERSLPGIAGMTSKYQRAVMGLEKSSEFGVGERPGDEKEPIVAGEESHHRVSWGGKSVVTDTSIRWTREAQIQTERIPSFIRDVVRHEIEKYAQNRGYAEITPEVVNEVKNEIMKGDSLHKV